MSTVTCIAKIKAQEMHKQTVLSELTKLIQPTLNEHGCINYDLHVDNENDSIFIFHENWVSEQDLNAHSQSSHVKNCFDVIGEMLDSAEVSRLTKVTF